MPSEHLDRYFWLIKTIFEYSSCEDPSLSGISSDELMKLNNTLRIRTFYRLRREIEMSLEINIKFNKYTKRYYIDNETPGEHNFTNFILERATKSLQDTDIDKAKKILIQLLIAERNPKTVEDIINSLNQQHKKNYNRFYEAISSQEISEISLIEPDKDYSNYINIKINSCPTWLSVGFFNDSIYFYIVTDKPNDIKHNDIIKKLDLDKGVKYKHGHYWHKPNDQSLYCIKFKDVPDINNIIEHTNILLSQIANA